MTDKKRVILICPNCGSDHVGRDANAVWSVEEQKFELGGIFDNGWCGDCDWEGDDSFVEKELAEGETYTPPLRVDPNPSAAAKGAEDDHRQTLGLVRDEDGNWSCPKCGAYSGDDWSQCRGSCPIKGSPHYKEKQV